MQNSNFDKNTNKIFYIFNFRTGYSFFDLVISKMLIKNTKFTLNFIVFNLYLRYYHLNSLNFLYYLYLIILDKFIHN